MMSLCDILLLCLLIYGTLFLCRSVFSLAYRRLTESFCVFWTCASLLMLLGGILLHPVGLNAMISPQGFIIIMLTAFAVMEAAYYLSKRISILERQNRELSMQIALLRHDVQSLEQREPPKG